MKGRPYLIQSFEYNRIAEALVLPQHIQVANTEATVPTVIGRVCDLGDDLVVGIFISEMLAEAYDITPGPWMEEVDQLYDGVHLVVPEYSFSQARESVKCYHRSQADAYMEYRRWTETTKR